MTVPSFRVRGRFSSATPTDEAGRCTTDEEEEIYPSSNENPPQEAAPGAKSLFHNLFRRHSDVGKTTVQDERKDKLHVRLLRRLLDLA